MYANESALRDFYFKMKNIARISDTMSCTASGALAGLQLRAYFKCPPQHL